MNKNSRSLLGILEAVSKIEKISIFILQYYQHAISGLLWHIPEVWKVLVLIFDSKIKWPIKDQAKEQFQIYFSLITTPQWNWRVDSLNATWLMLSWCCSSNWHLIFFRFDRLNAWALCNSKGFIVGLSWKRISQNKCIEFKMPGVTLYVLLLF